MRSRRFPRISWPPSPNGTYLETFHRDRDPMFYALVSTVRRSTMATIRCRERLVSGIEMDKSVIAKYRV